MSRVTFPWPLKRYLSDHDYMQLRITRSSSFTISKELVRFKILLFVLLMQDYFLFALQIENYTMEYIYSYRTLYPQRGNKYTIELCFTFIV